MSQTSLASPEAGHRPGRDVATINWRVLTALLVAIGPAAIAILRFILPYNTTDGSSAMARKVIAHPSKESAVIWLGLVAVFAMVPTVLWIGRVARRGSPRLAAAAVALMVPGYLALGGVLTSDVLLWAGAKAGTSSADLARAYDHLHPAVYVAEAVFVIGHVLGTVLLGLSLWRTPGVPQWVAAATVICQPTHFVAAVVLSNHSLDLAAWGLNAVAFAAVAMTVPGALAGRSS